MPTGQSGQITSPTEMPTKNSVLKLTTVANKISLDIIQQAVKGKSTLSSDRPL